jgi:hypothetical protein
MKKISFMILLLSMLFTLCACGAEPAVPAQPQDLEPEETFFPQEPAPDPTSEPEAESAPGPDLDTLFGKKDAHSYRNDHFDLSADFGEEWHIYTERELRADSEYPNIDTVMEYEKTGSVCPFTAVKTNGESGEIHIVIYDMGDLAKMGRQEDTYMQQTREKLKEAGAEVERKTVAFAGKEHFCLSGSMDQSGASYHYCFVCVSKGQYMAVIMAFADTEEEVKDILLLFRNAS